MAYAIAQDVEERLGRDLDPSEMTIVNARLTDAEMLIKAKIPDLVTQVTTSKIPRENVVYVEAEAVIRYLRNPEGVVGETDGNYSYQLNWANVKGTLTITPDEWALLGYREAIFTIAPRLYNAAEKADMESTTPEAPEWWWPWSDRYVW